MPNPLTNPQDKILSKSDGLTLFTLLGIGFITRMILFSQTYLISLDGAGQYLPLAELFAWGEYGKALKQPQLPAYPFLIALLSRWISDFELSGQLLSLLMSLLAVVPFFLLGKSVVGQHAAFWGSLFYFLNPTMLQCSGDVLKEGLLICLLFSAVYLFYMFLIRKGIMWLLGSIVVTLMAILTRVGSLMFIFVFIFWILFAKRKWFDAGFLKKLGYLAMVLVLCMSVLVPLILNVKAVTGRWDISKQGVTIHSLMESIFFDRSVELGEAERGLLPLVRKFTKVYHPLLLLFLLAGFIRRKVIPRDFFKEMFLLTFILGYLIIIGLMMWSTQRYLLFPILLSYLWAGVGVVEIQEKMVKKYHLSQAKWTLCFSIVIFFLFLTNFIGLHRIEKLGTKAIGFWIRDQEIGKPLILTDLHRVVYYAGGDLLIMDRLNYRESIAEAKRKGVKYIVVREKDLRKNFPDLIPLVQKDFFELDIPSPYSREQEKYFVFKSKD